VEGEQGIVNLTSSVGQDLGPTLSANGWWIAFQSDRDGDWEIYTMDIFGHHQTRQTYSPASDVDPVWSPACGGGPSCVTGTLAFQSDRTGNWDLFLLNTGTDAEPFQVTSNPGNDTDPFWAPDGSALVFQSDRNGNWDIFTIRPDGTDEVQWTNNPADEVDPVWSPTGTTIAYASNRSGDWDLYLLDVESGAETQLTSGDGDDLLPAWSPDGAWLAFQSNRDGQWDIYALELSTGDLVRLTDHPAADEAPSWNCDGTRVLFHSDRSGDPEIYSVALADPTDVVQLTQQMSAERNALWYPTSEDGSLTIEIPSPTPASEEPAAQAGPTTQVALPVVSGTAQGSIEQPGFNWLWVIGGVALVAVGLVIGWIAGSRKRS